MLFIKDIENKYSHMVQNYFNKGYRIYTKSMSGTQGEMSSIFLTNDKEIICLSLEKERKNRKDYLILYTRRYDNFNNGILWLNEEFVVDKIVYHIIDKWKDMYKTPFTNNKKEFNIMEEKRRKRECINSYKDKLLFKSVNDFTDKEKKIVLSFVKRQPKCKTVKLGDIKIVKHNGKYRIIVKNSKQFILK